MSVTQEDVRRIARLVRLTEPTDRLESLTGELNSILDWVEQLNEVNVKDVAPMTTPIQTPLLQRADDVTDGGRRDEILKNAPKAEEGFFVVPKSVE